MKKISKSMAKKIALMVLLSSAVGMHSVWAETTTVDVNPSVADKLGAEALTNNRVIVGQKFSGPIDEKYAYAYKGSTPAETATWTLGEDEVWGEVYGGYNNSTSPDLVKDNILTITGGEFSVGNHKIYGGRTGGTGNVSGNQINITGGTISQTVYGGFAQSGDASENIVTVSGAQTLIEGSGYIYGALVNSGTSGNTNNNAVIITEGTYKSASIAGGYAAGGNANNNQVVISGAAVVDDSKLQTSNIDIGGGYSNVGTAQTQENLVQVTTTTGHIRVKSLTGGNQTATKNTLVIGDTDVIANEVKNFEKYYFCIPESAKDGDTLLNNDTSFIFDGALCVQPKYSEEEYTVTLAKATYGGCCGWELPTGNSVNCTVSQDGEYVKYSQTGIISWVNVFSGSLTNNVVEVTSDTTATVNGTPQTLKSSDPGVTNWGNVYGGYSSAPGAYVMDNEVTITEGTVSDVVYGGYSSAGTTLGNSVTIEDGNVSMVCGGSSGEGGLSEGNRVTITGGTVSKVIYGGSAIQGVAKGNLVVISGGSISAEVYGGKSSGSAATGNTVVITGGTFASTSKIYGGYRNAGSGVETTNNTVQISTPIIVSTIIGGNKVIAGNTLIVDAKDVSATKVDDFPNYAFYLLKDTPKDTDAGAALTVTGGTVSLNSATIYVVPDYSWKAGDTYKLFSATSLTGGTYSREHDLAPGNTMTGAGMSVQDNTLSYTMGTISEWRSVQPSSLTGNKVELVANVSGKATAIVNGTTQTYITNDIISSSWYDVYGGYSTMKGAYVANNTVTISSGEGLAAGSIRSKIYGGYAPNGIVENNTLEVTVAGVEPHLVDGFDNYNFTLVPGTTETFMLSLRKFGDDFQGDTITVNLNGSELDSIILIQNRFVSSLKGITLKVTEDGTTFVSEEDARACFSVTIGEGERAGYYDLVFTNNLGVSLKPEGATNKTVVVTGDRTGTIDDVEIADAKRPKEGKTWKNVYGGYSEDTGAKVENNSLTIKDGTISGHVFGGYSKDGSVTNNKVTIEGGLIKGNVCAGYSSNSGAEVSGNELNWNGGTIKGDRIAGNTVKISGTGATYLGEDGMIAAAKPDETLVPVELTGTLTVGDTDTASKLTFTSGVNIRKEGKLVVTNGDVTLEKTSTLSGAIEGEKITNDGILNVDGSGKLTLAIAIAGDGTLNVESGTDLIYTGSEIENKVIIEQGATMDPDAGVFKKDVTNYGTLVLEGGNLGTKITNNGGTMKVTSPVTIDTNGAVTLDAGSTLAIAAANFTTDAAVKGITGTNFTLADGAKIKLTGDTDDETYYMLLAGENTAIVDLVSKVSDGLVDETGEQFTESDVKTNGDGTAIIAKVSTLNVDEMNLNSLVGIQQGMVSMQNITVDTVASHMGLINKAKGEGKYAKEIWASYLNNKDNVDGFNMAKYDAKYNGVTVGVDFYSSEKSVAGVALTYAKGDVSGNGIKSGIRNDSKYYGISFYDRVDLKNSALLMDLGYMNSKNDTNVSTTKSVTGDAKVDSYTLGVRWEKDYQFKNSKLVPFAGVRYLRLNSKDFGNSRGLNYSTNSQNLFQPKIGVAWAGDYKMKDSAWNFKPKAEVGYLWALGNREADTALNYKGHDKGNVLYDVTDKSSYYAKLGIEFNKKNFAAGVDYSYMKGSSVRSNRWNVNLSWSF